MEKQVGIQDKYTLELESIYSLLDDLEKGIIYEISHIPHDGYLPNKIIKLRGMIEELIDKIEYNKTSEIQVVSFYLGQKK
jgi:hypothetical protein